jgi:hypothetical protein
MLFTSPTASSDAAVETTNRRGALMDTTNPKGRKNLPAAKPALAKSQGRLKQLEQRAEAGLMKAASAAGGLARKHPAAAAGLLLGAGGLVGAAAQRAFRHEPTVGEVVLKALKRTGARLSNGVASAAATGMSAGKTRARRALR